jgi:hypothetical protein
VRHPSEESLETHLCFVDVRDPSVSIAKRLAIACIPRGRLAPDLDTVALAGPLKGVAGHMAEADHVSRSICRARPVEIVPEDDVEHPTMPVLDMPVARHGMGEVPG